MGKTKRRKTRDINSKRIFENKLLCSQFLRNYVDIPQFKNITEDDIENVTSRFTNYINAQYDSDVVNRVRVTGDKRLYYVVALHEHKSFVDYDVTMQILKYVVCIWERYAVSMKESGLGNASSRDFRYPVVIPIVYYEGESEWNASMNSRERVEYAEELQKFVPEFTYILVNLHEISNEELLNNNDEMALLMLINKVQSEESVIEFTKLPKERIDSILSKAPDQVMDIMADTIKSLFLKAGLDEDIVEENVKNFRRRKMGNLFENLQIDLRADREKIEYLQNEVNDTQSRLEETRLVIKVYKLAQKGTPAYLIAESLQVPLKKVERILNE